MKKCSKSVGSSLNRYTHSRVKACRLEILSRYNKEAKEITETHNRVRSNPVNTEFALVYFLHTSFQKGGRENVKELYMLYMIQRTNRTIKSPISEALSNYTLS